MTVKLGGQANAGIAAPLKLLRAILNYGSHLLSPLPRVGRARVALSQEPCVGGKGGVAVVLAFCGMQLEQLVLFVLQDLLWGKWRLGQSDPHQGGLGLGKEQQLGGF